MVTKALTTSEQNSRKNLEAIENWLCADDEDRSGMELTPKQQELLQRWSYADDLLRRDRDKHHEIVEQLRKKFDIRESSAWDDLRNAQIVFGSSNALNKRYTAYAQVRRIQDNIRLATQTQNWKVVTELEKILQKAIAALPDAQAPKSARTIIFNIQAAPELTITEADVQDAVKEAEDYLQYEELPPEDNQGEA